VRKEETHNCKMTAFIRGVLWTIKGAAKMERRVVDEVNVDFRRLVVLAVLTSTTRSDKAYKGN
jgi:hypothetical protein